MVVVIVIGIRGERQVVVVVTVIMYWRVIHVREHPFLRSELSNDVSISPNRNRLIAYCSLRQRK